MQIVGYQLLNSKDKTILKSWGGVWGQMCEFPAYIIAPNDDHVHCPELNVDYGGVTLVQWMMDDPKFYSDIGIQLPIEICQSALIKDVNSYVRDVLSESDWQIIRSTEGYKSASDSLITYRKAMRDQGNALVNEIKSMSDFDAIMAWKPHDWPVMK